MNTKPLIFSVLLIAACLGHASAQNKPAAPTGHEPPPQAYTDCAGKKAGESVQHSTPEGKVAATCENSPKGLVARPTRPKASQAKLAGN